MYNKAAANACLKKFKEVKREGTRPHSPPPHPHPTLTQSLRNPEPAIKPATFTPDPSLQYLPPPAATISTKNHHYHHQE